MIHRLFASAAIACAATVAALAAPTADSRAAPSADRWAGWIASEARCPGGRDGTAPARAQTLLCLVNYARQKKHLRPLTLSAALNSASTAKARDIARCGVFEHGPCGKSADAGARAVGYAGAWGENLFFGTGSYGVPSVAVLRWLQSPGHRANLFRPQWRTIGIARRARAKIGRVRNAVIWVNQFGDASASATAT